MFSKKIPDQYKPETVPAPVRGLNVYDSIVAMDSAYAIVMQNWWPEAYGCSVRKGYVEWATGMPSTVGSLATWYGNTDGSSKMYAWSDTAMYDITTRGAVGAAVVSGLSNAIWESVNFTNSAGSRMIAVNGVDNAITYTSGGGVQRIIAGDGIVANTWAGLNPQNAVQLTVHQRRLWAVKKDTTEGWYLPPDAFQGTFLKFDFGPQFSRGGYLQFLTTWTLDDGNGAEDHLLAVSSEGEAVVYSGTDPSSSTAWSLSGVYYVGSPVSGRRSFSKASGDQIVLTQRGVVSMADQLISTKVETANNPIKSLKIQSLISGLVTSYGSLNGWDLLYYPTINMVMINVPSVVAGGNIQLVANQITGAWSQFSGMDSACWTYFNDTPYFGNYSGKVYQAWTGYSDGVLLDNSGGAGIQTAVQQAYTYFGGRSNSKQVGLFRPTFVAPGNVAYSAAIVYDFSDVELATPSAAVQPPGSLWDTGTWDSAVWGGGSRVTQEWMSGEGMGTAISVKMITLSDTELLWVATDYSVIQSRGLF